MKTFLLIISLFFGVNAFAGNSFCDSRAQHRSRVLCYEQAINAQNNFAQTHMKELKNTMSADRFNALNHDSLNWTVEINNRCTTDLVCIYDSLRNRNEYLVRLRREHIRK